MGNLKERMDKNCKRIETSYYTGRTIIMGLSPDKKNMIQMYWTVGRSENSKNRYLLRGEKCIKTEPIRKDDNMILPELLIYNIARQYDNQYIITNGTQTDDIHNFISANGKFEEAIEIMSFEHDKPIYTPRISGLLDMTNKQTLMKFAIVKTMDQNAEIVLRHVYSFTNTVPGVGYCIHTYDFSNDCMPFVGEPYPVKLFNKVDDMASYYWSIIPDDKKVGLYVRFINIKDGRIEDRIINNSKVY